MNICHPLVAESNPEGRMASLVNSNILEQCSLWRRHWGAHASVAAYESAGLDMRHFKHRGDHRAFNAHAA